MKGEIWQLFKEPHHTFFMLKQHLIVFSVMWSRGRFIYMSQPSTSCVIRHISDIHETYIHSLIFCYGLHFHHSGFQISQEILCFMWPIGMIVDVHLQILCIVDGEDCHANDCTLYTCLFVSYENEGQLCSSCCFGKIARLMTFNGEICILLLLHLLDMLCRDT